MLGMCPSLRGRKSALAHMDDDDIANVMPNPRNKVPRDSSDPSIPNIMVLGPSGGGVSSVVNLIAGKNVARVSNDTLRCTTEMARYHIELKSAGKVVPVTLYDIPGFDLHHNSNSPLEFPRVPINLAIICMEDFPAQVKASLKYLRDVWDKQGGNRDVPVLVVINHIAPRPDAGWWEENKKHFAGIHVVADHVCLTRQEKQECTKRLHSVITQHLSIR